MAEEKQNVTIACNVTGKPRPSITWSKAFSSLPKDKAVVKNGALTIYNVAKNDGGTYMCKAENILGQATDTVQLVVFSPLQFKIRPPQVMTPSVGSNVRATCLAESDLKPAITWEKVGKLSLPVDTYFFPNGTLLFRDIKKIHQGSYICRATNALSTIETKVKINSPIKVTSCSMVRKYISSVSGNYVIDPDSVGGLAPFTVFCDMTDKSGVGVTVIGHDSESRTHVNGYSSQGSYSRDIHYTGASLSQLASLTRVSSHCEQFIKYECYHSVMFSPIYGSPYAWWVSRDSTKMTHWGGASINLRCACGMTNSCANSRNGCNCDNNDFVWREDSGLLTDKTKLPVKQLRFGDTSGTEQGYHTLGKLRCYGTA